ncbi:MAG: hypothetical protein CMB82_02310 [Flammeovirgaceae bacterium]|nr:hypothetical protein [Flammeovirgaceae bacterium]
MIPKSLKWLYYSVGLLHLWAIVFHNQEVLNATKPFLMPILLCYVYKSEIERVNLKTILLWISLVFAWLGDLALMQSDTYFLLGLGLFFIAQICYILLFFKAVEKPIEFKTFPLLPYLLAGILLFYILLPDVNELLVPIVIYGIILLTMAGVARLRQGRTNSKSYYYTLLGTLLFVISDSLLALNKFVWNIPYAEIGIMSTYMAAQLLITEGILKNEK